MMTHYRDTLYRKQLSLLRKLIATPSFSGEEDETASHIADWFDSEGIPYHRLANNLFAWQSVYDPSKPTLLLNSHHDTVRPNTAYTRNPFEPEVEGDRLYGLGSNDAGGALVCLLGCFAHFYREKTQLPFNLLVAATGEEENAGKDSLAGLLPQLPPIDLAIVGEPTLLDLAIAEKGLIVYDATVEGTPSHAAHPNDRNSIYRCIEALEWFRDFRFPEESDTLGAVKLTVTQISAGKQHNVVPAEVALVIDVRVNDCYTNEEIDAILQEQAPCRLKARSLRLESSSIPEDHLLVRCGKALGRGTYGSPTLSDQAALSCPSLKLGPGDSRRSHSADEYIHLSELKEGLELYINLIDSYSKSIS